MYDSRYSGTMQPMNRMSMDFQGRYMDSYGRMVDARYYEFDDRYYDNDIYYGRSMYNYDGLYDNDRYHRYGNFMDFSEMSMDMSRYQMDMNGRWMDMEGHKFSPYSHMFSSSRHGYYPGYDYGRNWFYPESFMDMSHYQMDFDGQWMDMYDHYPHPFSGYNHRWNNYYNHYPYYNYSWGQRFYNYPERSFDMSNYQMDFNGRWMNMHRF